MRLGTSYIDVWSSVLEVGCALSIHQKECRKSLGCVIYIGARYLPENTVIPVITCGHKTVNVFLFLPPFWPHEWLKHVGGYYVIKLYSYTQLNFVDLFKHVIYLIKAQHMEHKKQTKFFVQQLANQY
jgi:hypothetical protein